jgi:PTS system nitrogen regulatory IIA component
MKVSEFLDRKAVVEELSAGNRLEAFTMLCTALVDLYPELNLEELVHILLEREKLGNTGVGEGVAIPHGKLMNLERPISAFGRSPRGVEFEAVDNRPVHLFFLLFAPEGEAGAQLRALATISRLLKSPSVREELLAVDSKEQIYDVLTRQDRQQNAANEKGVEIVL